MEVGGIVAAVCSVLLFAYIMPPNAANTPAKACLLRDTHCAGYLSVWLRTAFPFVISGALSYCLVASLYFLILTSHALSLLVPDGGQDPLRVNLVQFVSNFKLYTRNSSRMSRGPPALPACLVSLGTVRHGGWETEVPLVPGPHDSTFRSCRSSGISSDSPLSKEVRPHFLDAERTGC